MNRKTQFIIVAQFLVIVTLFWLLMHFGKDRFDIGGREPSNPVASSSKSSSEDGITIVKITRKAQKLSGIQTEELEQVSYRPNLSAFGSVVAIDTLLDLRIRFLGALAQVNLARVTAESSKRDAERQRLLNRDDRNVSDRVAEAAETQAKGDAARLAAAETLASGLRDSIRQQWPEPIASWAIEPQPTVALQNLLDRREVLININLPSSAPVLNSHSQIEIRPQGLPGKPLNAIYVGPAPHSDPLLRGRSYYFRAPATGLHPGMRVVVRQQDRQEKRTGVIIPASAVIWYAGKAWVYEEDEDDPEEFVRRQIPTDNETDSGWFVADLFELGDRIVINGAQLLLSEEFKYQITNENDD